MKTLIWLLASLIILFLLFILILFTKLTILLTYFHHNDNDDLKVEFRIWFGLIRYKKSIPLIKVDEDSPSIVVKSSTETGNAESSKPKVTQITNKDVKSYWKRTQDLLKNVKGLQIIIRKFSQKISIKEFEWQTMIGIGDAAHTAILTGALWTLKGSVIGVLSQYLKLKTSPKLSITPQFQGSVVQTYFQCIFQFRIGYAILAGLKLIKFWKGGKPPFKNKSNFSNDRTKSI
ncbi:DUF2953 domain-containing protein [Neobacillus rhizophilus]|uniref:DUF2953 domain-containing protein n=1 Tax=Neobacillus rhizophilus TaxID=2833579 RepID=UPI0027DCE00F|nr:DUF2953 domain-containing protein [Neobacillus rhizophilus]